MTTRKERIESMKKRLKEEETRDQLDTLKKYKKYLGMETEEQYKRFVEVMNTKHGELTTTDYIKGVSQKTTKETPKPTTTPTEPRHAMGSNVASSTSPLVKK